MLVAVLHLGNLTLAAKGEEDASFTKETTKHVAACAKLLGVPASPQGGTPEEVLSKAILSQNIKAGLDWIAKPNTSDYAQSVKDALSKAVRGRMARARTPEDDAIVQHLLDENDNLYRELERLLADHVGRPFAPTLSADAFVSWVS